MIFVQRLMIVVGTPGSGKDELIRAVNNLGSRHARIVPKHTSRQRWEDDGDEMICVGDEGYDLKGCEITYENYGDSYGIKLSAIWDILKKGIFPVVVVSNVEAINKLHKEFGGLVVLVYVHSEVDAEERYRAREYRRKEARYKKDTRYVKRRVAEYELAYRIYLNNLLAFDHVLINSGPHENLFDQIFRLFRAYEHGLQQRLPDGNQCID